MTDKINRAARFVAEMGTRFQPAIGARIAGTVQARPVPAPDRDFWLGEDHGNRVEKCALR